MRIKSLFPKFDVDVKFENLGENAGQYWTRSDTIVLDTKLYRSMPGVAKIVFLHEMFHSTAADTRLMRFERLITKLGKYTKGSLSYKTEECIVEIATLVACKKLGLLNQYSKNVILPGLREHYTEGMSIPWREVVAAVRYFAADDEDFTEELKYVKRYIQTIHKIVVQDTYQKNRDSAA